MKTSPRTAGALLLLALVIGLCPGLAASRPEGSADNQVRFLINPSIEFVVSTSSVSVGAASQPPGTRGSRPGRDSTSINFGSLQPGVDNLLRGAITVRIRSNSSRAWYIYASGSDFTDGQYTIPADRLTCHGGNGVAQSSFVAMMRGSDPANSALLGSLVISEPDFPRSNGVLYTFDLKIHPEFDDRPGVYHGTLVYTLLQD